MTTFNYSKGDRITFKRSFDEGIREGYIETVDYADPSAPYYVVTPNGGFWIDESEVESRLSNTSDERLERVEAKLDAIIKHFNVPFELEEV